MNAHIDAHHQSEVRFYTMENLLSNAAIPGAARVLDDEELLLMSAEEPLTFIDAEHDQHWRRAMLEEMKGVKGNRA